MKKIMSLILALTLVLSFGSFMASAASTEATDVTTVAPVNYATEAMVKSITSASGTFTTAKLNAVLADDDNDSFKATPATDVNYYLNFSSGIGNITNNTRTVNNVWFMVELSGEQVISAVYVDQWNDRIREYKVYATSNETLAAEIKAASNSNAPTGLSKKGEKHYDHKTDDTRDLICEGEGIIDKLVAEGALVASGNLNGNNTVTTSKNTVVFDNEKRAKYIIFVVEKVPSSSQSNSVTLDQIQLLGSSEKNEINIDQCPKSVINYADKSVYGDVAICTGNEAEKEVNLSKNGSIYSLVDPNSTTMNNSVMDVPTFLLTNTDSSGAKSYTPNSWFAIDLGEVRAVDSIEIYQWKDRLSEVEVYTLTAEGYNQADLNGGNGSTSKVHLSDNFMKNHATLVKTQSIYHTGISSSALNTTADLTTPSIIDFDNTLNTRYILVRASRIVDMNSGIFLRRVMVKSAPIANYENAYPANGIDYTAKFVNKDTAAKKYAIVEAQYNENDEMIANNIKYVDIAPLYTKSFTGNIVKVDGAKTIKVFSWCMSDLAPLETQYTFNVQ